MTRLKKSTRYALYATMEMAMLEPDGQVTAARVAGRYRIPRTVMAKVFQQLVHTGIAVGARGPRGGYRLARKPSEVTVLDVVEAFEPTAGGGERCLLDNGADGDCLKTECRLKRLFDEVDELGRSTFASVTLETLVGRPRPGMGAQPAGEVREAGRYGGN